MLKYILNRIIKKLYVSAVYKSNVDSSSKIEPGSSFLQSTMQRYSFCGYNCDIQNTDIGSFCSIANNTIIGGGAHPTEWVSSSPVFYNNRDSVKKKFARHEREASKRVLIGHDVWIGNNCIIKQGIKIGTGSVIGMGAVVTKDIPPYAIVGGVPAKILKYRFEEHLINELLLSEWWKLQDSELEALGKYAKDPQLFLKQISIHKKAFDGH